MCTVRKRCLFWVKGAFQQSNSRGHPLVTTKSVVHNMFYKTCFDDFDIIQYQLGILYEKLFRFFLSPVAGWKMCFVEGLGHDVL